MQALDPVMQPTGDHDTYHDKLGGAESNGKPAGVLPPVVEQARCSRHPKGDPHPGLEMKQNSWRSGASVRSAPDAGVSSCWMRCKSGKQLTRMQPRGQSLLPFAKRRSLNHAVQVTTICPCLMYSVSGVRPVPRKKEFQRLSCSRIERWPHSHRQGRQTWMSYLPCSGSVRPNVIALGEGFSR